MAIIIDADVIIRGERGTFKLDAWVASRSNETFEIAVITVAELWHGVERATGNQRTKRRHYLENILTLLPIVPYTEQTAYEHARVWGKLRENDRVLRRCGSGHGLGKG